MLFFILFLSLFIAVNSSIVQALLSNASRSRRETRLRSSTCPVITDLLELDGGNSVYARRVARKPVRSRSAVRQAVPRGLKTSTFDGHFNQVPFLTREDFHRPYPFFQQGDRSVGQARVRAAAREKREQVRWMREEIERDGRGAEWMRQRVAQEERNERQKLALEAHYEAWWRQKKASYPPLPDPACRHSGRRDIDFGWDWGPDGKWGPLINGAIRIFKERS